MRISRVFALTPLCAGVLLFCTQTCFSQTENRPSVGVVDQNAQVALKNVFTQFASECLARHKCDCASLFISPGNTHMAVSADVQNAHAKPAHTHLSPLISNGMEICNKLVNTPLPPNTEINTQVEYMSFVKVFVPNTVFGVAVVREVDTHNSEEVATEYAVLVSFYGDKIQFMHIYEPLVVQQDTEEDGALSKGVMDKIRSITKSLQSGKHEKHNEIQQGYMEEPVDREFAGEIITPNYHHKNEDEKHRMKHMFEDTHGRQHLSPEMKKVVEDVKQGFKDEYHDLKIAGNKSWKDFKEAVKDNGFIQRFCANDTSPKECARDILNRRGFNITIPRVFYDRNQNEGVMVTLFTIPESDDDVINDDKLEEQNAARSLLQTDASDAEGKLKDERALQEFEEKKTPAEHIWQELEPGIRSIQPFKHIHREEEDKHKDKKDRKSDDKKEADIRRQFEKMFAGRHKNGHDLEEFEMQKKGKYFPFGEEEKREKAKDAFVFEMKESGQDKDEWRISGDNTYTGEDEDEKHRGNVYTKKNKKSEYRSDGFHAKDMYNSEEEATGGNERDKIQYKADEDIQDKNDGIDGGNYRDFMDKRGKKIGRDMEKMYEGQMKKYEHEYENMGESGKKEHKHKHDKHDLEQHEKKHEHEHEKHEHEHEQHEHEQHEHEQHEHEKHEHEKHEHEKHEHEKHEHEKHEKLEKHENENEKHEHEHEKREREHEEKLQHEHEKHQQQQHEKHEKREHEHEEHEREQDEKHKQHEHEQHEHEQHEHEQHEREQHEKHEQHEHEKREHENHGNDKHEHDEHRREHEEKHTASKTEKHFRNSNGEFSHTHNGPCVKESSASKHNCFCKKRPRTEAMLTYFKINEASGLVDKLIMIPTTDSLIDTYSTYPEVPQTKHGIAFLVVLIAMFFCFIYALYKHSRKEILENDTTPYLLTEPTNNYHSMSKSSQ